MHKRLAWMILCLAVPLGRAQDRPTGRGAEMPPSSSGFLVLDDEDLRSPLTDLSIHLAKLKGERQALGEVRDRAAEQAQETTSSEAHDSAKLRLRLGELLSRVGMRKEPPRAIPKQLVPPPTPGVIDAKPDPKPPIKEGPPKNETPAPEIGKPLDPLALAQALFRAGNYAGAMQAYKIIPQEGLKADERAPLQYMIATCLKKMGKNDDAATIYREVANSKGDEQLAVCAQWQLSALRWHREVTDKLKEVRQRSKALEK